MKALSAAGLVVAVLALISLFIGVSDVSPHILLSAGRSARPVRSR